MIDLLPTSEQQEIADTVGAFLAEKLPVSRYRRARLGGVIDPALWQEIAAMGWIGLSLPEDFGGSGYTVADEVLILREFGRHLAPMRLLANALGAQLAMLAGNHDLVGKITAGICRVALALPASAITDGGPLVAIDAADADLIVGWDHEGGFAIDRAALGAAEPMHAIDPTLDLVRFANTPSPTFRVASGAIATTALLLVSAMLAGMAEAARDMAVDYAKQREQFGQPIGAFQAIKHICADMALRAEAAGAQTLFAALKSAADPDGDISDILAARLVAYDAALLNAASNIQVHGGMGFTAECDAHLFVKRAHILDQLSGGQRQNQSQFIRLIADGDGERLTV